MMNLTSSITRGNTPLTNDQLMRTAPSVFATQPWDKMSARYAFIPTIQVVEKMRSEGFLPVAASQSRTRIAEALWTLAEENAQAGQLDRSGGGQPPPTRRAKTMKISIATSYQVTGLYLIEARDESGLVVLTREAKTLRAPQSSVWRWTRHAAVR
jgi:hypothetical protein